MWFDEVDEIINVCSVSLFQLSQQLDGLLGMLCADVAPADGAAIQQTLKHLEEKLKSVGEVILLLLNCVASFVWK